MHIYKRKIHYYETDQMGIVHHSNYIRFFEEARVSYLEAIGYPYQKLEARNLFSPLTGVNCRYHAPLVFGDEILIIPRLSFFNGVRMHVSYTIKKADDTETLYASGETQHCFTNRSGRPVSLKKMATDVYTLFSSYVIEGE